MSCSKQAQGDSVFAVLGHLAKKILVPILEKFITAWETAKEKIQFIIKEIIFKAVDFVTQKGIDAIFAPIEGGEKEKTNKDLDSKVDEAFLDLKKKIKALHEDFKKLKEITAGLEKNQGNEEEEIPRTLKCVENMYLLQLSKGIQTLEEDVQKWPETIKHDLQDYRECLEMKKVKKEGTVQALLKSVQQLIENYPTVKEGLQECPEITNSSRLFVEACQEKNQENEEEEIARALESRLKENHQQFSRRIEILKENVRELLNARKCELELHRAELEKNQGNEGEEIARVPGSNLNLGRRCNAKSVAQRG